MFPQTYNLLSFPSTAYPVFFLILKNNVSNMTWIKDDKISLKTMYIAEKKEEEEHIHYKTSLYQHNVDLESNAHNWNQCSWSQFTATDPTCPSWLIISCVGVFLLMALKINRNYLISKESKPFWCSEFKTKDLVGCVQPFEVAPWHCHLHNSR